MPLPQITPEESAEAYQRADAAIRFFLDQQGIDPTVQIHLFRNNCVSMRRFANLESDEDKIREVLRKEFGMDSDDRWTCGCMSAI